MQDRLTHYNVTFKRHNQITRDKVKGDILAPDGSVAGCCNCNLVLNTIACDVEFLGGEVRECTVITIAEHILTIVNSDAHLTLALDSVLDFNKIK